MTDDPASIGTTEVPYETGVVGIHVALMHTGEALLWSFEVEPPAGPDDDPTLTGASRVLEPTTGDLTTPPVSHHVFCAGQTILPDGTVFVAGGCDDEVSNLHLFHPASGEWELAGTMAGWSESTLAGADPAEGGITGGRWYPTCTKMADGRVMIMSGTTLSGGPETAAGLQRCMNRTLEVYTPGVGIGEPEELPSPFSSTFPADLNTIDYYPFVYALPDGMLAVHSRNTTRFYDTENKWDDREFRNVRPQSRSYPGEASSVLLPLLPSAGYRARILIAGGGGADEQDDPPLTLATPATDTVEILDLGDDNPEWRLTAPLAFARVMHDATLLPDGTVLVTGGSSVGMAGNKGDGPTVPVMSPELFDPEAETWTTMAEMTVPRLYHSTACLLPDARVLLTGTDGFFNPPPAKDEPELRAEIFSPPYLFKGPRPVISGAPPRVAYGASFAVQSPDAARITFAALLSPGAATHSFNMCQRYVGLTIVASSSTTVTLTAPPDGNTAPPGHYMLFALDDQGIPSVALFIQVG